MIVPINIPILGSEEIAEVNRVLRGGLLTSASRNGGPNVVQFEKEARKYLGVKYAVSVNSGTAALQAALYCMDVRAGDEVLIPSFTFVATANAVASTGAKPVFVDIDENYTIDPDDLEKKITKRSKAVIPVHLYGNIAKISRILQIARSHGLWVIEDAAQSMGSTRRGKHTGTFGDAGCYSLYPGKIITAGEGGLVVTDSKKLYEKLLMIRNHGMVYGYDSKIFGLNLRMPEISAAIAKIQVKKLPSFLKKRTVNARILSEKLAGLDIALPREQKYDKLNWSLYTISTTKQHLLRQKLNKAGFGASIYYPTPVHKIPFYHNTKKLPVTEWASGHVLSLPIHPRVTADDLERMTRVIKKAIK